MRNILIVGLMFLMGTSAVAESVDLLPSVGVTYYRKDLSNGEFTTATQFGAFHVTDGLDLTTSDIVLDVRYPLGNVIFNIGGGYSTYAFDGRDLTITPIGGFIFDVALPNHYSLWGYNFQAGARYYFK